MTHVSVGNLTIIGSDNGLSPGRRHTVIWTNAGILLIGPLGTNFNEISTEILTFSFKKMRLKVSSAKWQPFCVGLNVFTAHSVPDKCKMNAACSSTHSGPNTKIGSNYIDDLAQGYSIYRASAMEIPQSSSKPLITGIQTFHTTMQVTLKSLWPSDAIWRHKSGSTLDQVMACCHYLNQCWPIIKGFFFGILMRAFSQEILKISIRKTNFEIISTLTRDQWINSFQWQDFQAGITIKTH